MLEYFIPLNITDDTLLVVVEDLDDLGLAFGTVLALDELLKSFSWVGRLVGSSELLLGDVWEGSTELLSHLCNVRHIGWLLILIKFCLIVSDCGGISFMLYLLDRFIKWVLGEEKNRLWDNDEQVYIDSVLFQM